MMEPKFLLIVKVALGLNILDTPRPQSQGAKVRRAVPVGSQLYATVVINIGGVPYACLVPQDPLKPEWVRVAEADHSIEYVDMLPLQSSSTNPSSDLAVAINNLANAIRSHV